MCGMSFVSDFTFQLITIFFMAFLLRSLIDITILKKSKEEIKNK